MSVRIQDRVDLRAPGAVAYALRVMPLMLLILCCRLDATALSAVWPAPASGSTSADPLSVPAKQWAADAAQNELLVIQYHPPLLRYREHVVNSKGDEIRDVIESKDGAVARVIYRDNHLVTPDQDAEERKRLEDVIHSPAAFAKHIKNDQNGKKLASDLLQLFPTAMIYSYAAGQPQRPNRHAGDPPEVVVDFTPDPKWNPPSLTSEALTGLRGRLWIDERTHRIMRMEGDIFQQVNFGWGFFAHVYPGGKLVLEQVSINDQRWIFSRFTESVVVRAMLIKTFRETSDVSASNYTVVNPMSYQDAVRVLLATPLPK